MADRRDRATLARQAARLNAQSPFAGLVPPLVLMTDDVRLPQPLAAARALPRGSLVIVRSLEAVRRAELAASMLAIARERGLLVSIAADPGLSRALGADGVHFPQAALGTISHWRRPGWLISAAVHDSMSAHRAVSLGAGALLLSPVFSTASHPGAAGLGPVRFEAIARRLPVPVYGLGGIDAHRARRLSAAAGIAAIGALAV